MIERPQPSVKHLTLHTRVGKDGILKLEAPIGIADAELEVILVVHRLEKQAANAAAPGWMPGFFQNVVGGWQGEPLVRKPQGTCEARDGLR